MQFTPIKNFTDADLRSEYLVGYTYTVRPDNARLLAKVDEWRAAGLVAIGTAAEQPSSPAKLRGAGTVK